MHVVSSRAALRYELRLIGMWLVALPAFVALLFVIAAATMAYKQAHQLDIQHMVMTGLEGGLPLAAGIVIATIAAQDGALELQLAMPVPYRWTVLRRFLLVLGLTALIEAAAELVLSRAWPWTLSQDGSAYLLAWLPTLLWFGGWGALLALLLRSRAAAAAILGVAWVIELTFHGLFPQYAWTRLLYIFATMFSPAASFWLANRLELLATAALLFVVVWLYLRNPEWRLRGEDH
jgi:hypothetical protein